MDNVIEITLKEAVDYFNSLKRFNYKGVKFNYAITKLLVQLDKEVDIVRKASKSPVEYVNYQKQLAKAGNDQEKVAQLNKKFKKVIEEREKQISEVEELMENTKIKVNISKVDMNDLPDDITTADMAIIMKLGMINE